MREDDFGIPYNMFGPVPETFFAMVGRVVMVASLLDLRLLDLLTELEQAPQDKHAGRPASGLVMDCRTLLKGYDTPFTESATRTLDLAKQALHERNAVVHSVWPNPSAEGAYGWRPVPKARRDPPSQPYESIVLDEGMLRKMISRTVAQIHDVDRLRQCAAAHHIAT